jgi:putative ABC transport system ATP-binding protein
MNANESLSRVGPVVRTRGLEKEYGRGAGLVRALDAVEFDVASGETLAVMGPSGCGKSTLLHLLGGLERPSAGEVWLAGRRIDQLSEKALARLRRRAIGFVFQAFHLMDELTAVENVELPALLAGRSPRAARRRAAELLEQVGLADRARHLPSALSGGERQRVAIARALGTSRSSSSPTNRRATSTALRPWTCSGCSTACARPGRRSSSSPTTRGSRPQRTG